MEVETQGAEGAKDVLSQQAIDEADVVIIAADIHVDPARFQGKPMHAVSTSDAIRKTKAIIENALKEAEDSAHRKCLLLRWWKQIHCRSYFLPDWHCPYFYGCRSIA